MSEENKKLNDEELKQIAGGNDGMGDGTFSVVDIPDTWVRVTASELNCRYWPNGSITTDGLWYRLWIYNPQGGECNGYIYKAYTEPI